MSIYRFTINVDVPGVDGEDFETFAGVLLDEMLRRQAGGQYRGASVTGRVSERQLRLQIEFECEAHNKAHNVGIDRIADTLASIGAELVMEPPLRAVTHEHDGDDFDTKVEELVPHRRVIVARTELVPA